MSDPAPNHRRLAIRTQILNRKGQKVLNGTFWEASHAAAVMKEIMEPFSIARARGGVDNRWLYYASEPTADGEGFVVRQVKPTKEMTEAFRVSGLFTPKNE